MRRYIASKVRVIGLPRQCESNRILKKKPLDFIFRKNLPKKGKKTSQNYQKTRNWGKISKKNIKTSKKYQKNMKTNKIFEKTFKNAWNGGRGSERSRTEPHRAWEYKNWSKSFTRKRRGLIRTKTAACSQDDGAKRSRQQDKCLIRISCDWNWNLQRDWTLMLLSLFL